MSDHFRTIGFTLEREELESLVARAISNGAIIPARHGDYHVWTPGAGAELWVHTHLVDGRRELAGANPHFNGEARTTAIVEALAPDAEHALEGELYAWASEGDREHGLYPFSASVPDFDGSLALRDVPFRTTLALASFAHDLTWWEDESAHARSRADAGDRLPITPIVPLGLFASGTGRARSQAIVTGTVLESETRINPATERAFRRMRVTTYGGDIDILAAPEIVEGLPPVGSIVRATCWLTARIVA